MKLKDLYESHGCLVAKYYKDAAPDYDTKYNREAAKNKDVNQSYYDTYFSDGSTPVFRKPLHKEKAMSTKPDATGKKMSAGARGLKIAKSRAGHTPKT